VLEYLDPNILRFLEAKEPRIRIESWSNAARTIQIRGFHREGTISHDHITKADRSRATETFRIPVFPIMVQVSPATAPVRRGECYVRLTLELAGYAVGRLMAGYLTDGKTLTWPPGVHEEFLSGEGLLRLVLGTDPAAGSEVVETVPTNAVWRILSVRVSLVTDSTVANRRPALYLDDGTTTLFVLRAAAVQAAGLTRTYHFIRSFPNPTLDDTSQQYIWLPDIKLRGGYRIRTSTENLQAGDDYTQPVLLMEEWIEE